MGAALLAGVIGALVIGQGLHGWRMTGTAAPLALPAPPSSGSCLAPRTSDEQLVDPGRQPDVVPCTGPHSAEVFFVGTVPGRAYPLTGVLPPSRQPVLEAAVRTCHDEARRYLGEFDVAARWRVPPQLYIKVVVPTPLWRSGQHWFGCQAAATRGPETISFTGTMRGAYSAHAPPALLGTCGASVGDDRVACTAAHQAEELSVAPTPNRLQALKGTDAATMPPCPAIAAALIGTADPTFGGRLTVSDHVAPLERSCWIVTTNGTRLVGSMIGHGDSPLVPG